MEDRKEFLIYSKMYIEKVHIGLSTKTSKVVGTIEFEEDVLIYEGLGHKYFNGKLDLYRQNYYIGEWMVDLWGRDKAGTLIGESIFGGYAEAEWEGDSTIALLRFWKLTKVEEKVKRGRNYFVIYSGKRHWDIDEELYQREKDFLPVLFSLTTDPANDVEFEAEGVFYINNGFNTVAVVKSEDENLHYKDCLTIPPTVSFRKKSYTVTEIRDVQDCNELTEVKLPDTITLIARNAFFGSHNIQTINLPEGIKTIEEGAFWGCAKIQKIDLPKNCGVGRYAFAFCEGLKEISLNEQTSYDSETFRNCISLEKIVLPQTVRELRHGVFRGCVNLKKVELNEGLKSIDGDCFSGCAIEELRIPKTVGVIDAPLECNSLKNIIVDPDNDKLRSVDGVVYSEGMKRLEVCPTGKEGEVVIPDGVVYIESHAFQSCSRITKVVIPDSVLFIGWESFYGCRNLHTVIIGNGVDRIQKNTFSYCENLSTLVIGNSVENIEGKAFYGCKSLTRVDLPSTIKHYGMSLFEKCPNLTELTMPEWMERDRKDIMDYASGKRSTGGWY